MPYERDLARIILSISRGLSDFFINVKNTLEVLLQAKVKV